MWLGIASSRLCAKHGVKLVTVSEVSNSVGDHHGDEKVPTVYPREAARRVELSMEVESRGIARQQYRGE